MGRTEKVTRAQVLAAARDVFVERGYAGATLADIGARLSVSPAALLRHAPTKRDLFFAAMGTGTGPGEDDLLPLRFLEAMDGSEDPRAVLRRVAETMVPFLESKIREVVARWVHFKSVPGVGRMPLPFDPGSRPTPPQRNLGLLEDYMRRAVRRERLSVADPKAAAFAFFCTVHSFVFLQSVLEVLETPMPLSQYLETVLEVWTRGATPAAAPTRGRNR